MPNIGKKRHNKDIGGQDVVEKTSTEILPPLDSVCSFFNGVIELSFGGARSKLESKIFPVSLNGKIRPLRDNFLKAGSEVLDFVIASSKGDDNTLFVFK